LGGVPERDKTSGTGREKRKKPVALCKTGPERVEIKPTKKKRSAEAKVGETKIFPCQRKGGGEWGETKVKLSLDKKQPVSRKETNNGPKR